MAEIIQPSFAKGELAPSLHGRVDTAAYRVGLATARNAIVHTYGGISRRPGSKYIGPAKDHSYSPRLIPFEFKTTDTYMLEFGNLYMRVIRNDGHVLNADNVISGATKANPCVITATGHTLSNGDEVYINEVVGMTELNLNRYIVANKAANTFEIQNQVTGVNVDSTGFTTYGSAGAAASIYTLTTTYATADLDELKYVQSADIMTIVHPSYIPRELARTGHNAWALTIIDPGPTIVSPSDVVSTEGTTGSIVDRYRVTAIDINTDEESLPALDNGEAVVSGATQASPVVLTITSHPFENGDEIQIDQVVGMTELNGQRYFVQAESTNAVSLVDRNGTDINGTSFTAYGSAGIARTTFTEETTGVSTRDNTLTWTAVSGAIRYAVYRAVNGVYGFIGEAEGAAGAASGTTVTFLDDNFTPNTSLTPPNFRNPFPTTTDNPGAVGYHEQRRVFGGSLGKPDTTEYSQIGNQSNFNRTQPLQADDAITATLTSSQVNDIRHYVSLNDLLIFTSGSEWRVNAGSDVGFTFSTIRQKPQTALGSSHLRPFVADNTVIFCEENKARIRSFGYSLQRDGYTGSDLGILANHLLENFTLVYWTYQSSPEGRVYMVRSDGELLSMSFDQNHEVVAWTHWDTSGKYEAIERLRQGGSEAIDKIYTVVRRSVDGNFVRYIEMTQQTPFKTIEDAFFVDSGLSLDDPKTITAITKADPIVVTSASHGFSNGDYVDFADITWDANVDSIFNETQPDQLNGKRYLVSNKSTNTFEITDLDGVDIDGSAYNVWVEGGVVRQAVLTVSGLEHLEGRDVAVLADGNVIAGLTVASAKITLPSRFSRIHVGLAYITDIETLNIEAPNGTIQPYKKKISEVTITFNNTRGLFIGPSSDKLVEMKQREYEAMADPTAVLTGTKNIILKPDWNSNGRVFMRNPYPLPMTILAVSPSVETGEFA